MRSLALLATAAVAATLAGAGGAVSLERNRYERTMRPLLADVTEPSLFAPSRLFRGSPFFLAAERLKRVEPPAAVRMQHRRLVRLLVSAEAAVAEAFSSWSSPARERAERTVREIYATIRAICEQGYDIARMCDERG